MLYLLQTRLYIDRASVCIQAVCAYTHNLHSLTHSLQHTYTHTHSLTHTHTHTHTTEQSSPGGRSEPFSRKSIPSTPLWKPWLSSQPSTSPSMTTSLSLSSISSQGEELESLPLPSSCCYSSRLVLAAS